MNKCRRSNHNYLKNKVASDYDGGSPEFHRRIVGLLGSLNNQRTAKVSHDFVFGDLVTKNCELVQRGCICRVTCSEGHVYDQTSRCRTYPLNWVCCSGNGCQVNKIGSVDGTK